MVDEAMLAAIEGDERYQRLVRERAKLGWSLAGLLFAAYVGFTLLIAFDKPLLARSIWGGVTSLGIPLGFGLILLAVALTGIYVARANRAFDALTAAIIAEHGE